MLAWLGALSVIIVYKVREMFNGLNKLAEPLFTLCLICFFRPSILFTNVFLGISNKKTKNECNQYNSINSIETKKSE